MLIEAEKRNFNRVAFKLISSVNDPSNNAQYRQPFSLKAVDSQTIIHDQQTLMFLATEHYTSILNVPANNVPHILTLHKEGDEGVPLEQPITAEEIHAATSRLNNHKATGNDELRAELVKYSSEHGQIKAILAEAWVRLSM